MRRLIRPFLTSVAIGVGFASFWALAQPAYALQTLVMGAITGVTIYSTIALLQRLASARIERFSTRPRYVLHSLTFLVGGTAGWLIGMSIGGWLMFDGMSLSALLGERMYFFLAVIGCVAVAMGLAFYTYGAMRERLEQTVWAEKELELARKIQERLLPPAFVEGDGYTVSARNLPAQLVAGDFYEVVPLDDGSIVVAVGDVAGKGMGASLIMASVKAVLPFVARLRVEDAMATLNRKLVAELDKRQFVALAYARFSPRDGTLHYANAGIPDPYVVSASGVRVLEATGPRLPLGVKSGLTYETSVTTLQPGERLLFVSDGLPEAPVAGEPLGYDRFAELVASMDGAAHGEAWLDALLARVRAAVDDGYADDWTAVVVEMVP
ncbi:MAG TPA: PP2C family protein-serine/threonine phosphatase [Thermoanaerobaculia bacterium]